MLEFSAALYFAVQMATDELTSSMANKYPHPGAKVQKVASDMNGKKMIPNKLHGKVCLYVLVYSYKLLIVYPVGIKSVFQIRASKQLGFLSRYMKRYNVISNYGFLIIRHDERLIIFCFCWIFNS